MSENLRNKLFGTIVDECLRHFTTAVSDVEAVSRAHAEIYTSIFSDSSVEKSLELKETELSLLMLLKDLHNMVLRQHISAETDPVHTAISLN